MANFESGVASYIKMTATVTVNFPVDFKGNADVCCAQCFYFRKNYRTCGLNGQICEYPDKYIGSQCPLIPEKNLEDDKK